MNRIIALVVAIVIVAFAASSTVLTVDPRHAAVLSGRDGTQPELAGPGVHFKLPPPLQTATLIDTRLQSLESSDPLQLATEDKHDLLVAYAVKYRISDPMKYFTATGGDPAAAAERLSGALKSALGDAFGKRALDDALGGQRAIADAARDAAKASATGFGVDVVDVQLTRVDLPAAQTDAVYQRMIGALRDQAAQVRAQGAADVEQIKADAEREQQAVLANAYKSAQTIKGEGDAKAATIAADAFGRDPQFYQFYASLQAYRNTFKRNDIIVVDPDSEFFRFMRSPTGGAAPAAPAPRKH
ncbi:MULTISPECIES: protease modulator HflC [Burkholderia]|uniref:protease modulator HflC n=1 Tax=Burkholderia TaxID=32008 RepID=UPI000DABB11D|nr:MULTISPECIES: protease modulator HflC [Burkholderia]MDP9543901.1 membrane protease subunit HflC [Burkholderia cepacia]MBR8391593.1 protease modulator HflC [Burkholderia cenocepacia]MBR8471032.1 protease modulator HflC [Burkholderia cenocepacia]MBR8492767.1 protease modulator HflC [Burkholderia cenocepacia]MDO5918406.1 protease modulator HflC [Burkholderia cenocepacia]